MSLSSQVYPGEIPDPIKGSSETNNGGQGGGVHSITSVLCVFTISYELTFSLWYYLVSRVTGLSLVEESE